VASCWTCFSAATGELAGVSLAGDATGELDVLLAGLLAVLLAVLAGVTVPGVTLVDVLAGVIVPGVLVVGVGALAPVMREGALVCGEGVACGGAVGPGRSAAGRAAGPSTA
jgi:hypothetical protein